MIYLGELIEQNIDTIIEQWIRAIRQHRRMDEAQELSDLAIRDHVPSVIAAIAERLKAGNDDRSEDLVELAGLIHGEQRAQQGFDPPEVVREYRLLRQTVFEVLQVHLDGQPASEIVQGVNTINHVIDVALTYCFESYVEERLKELERLQEQVSLTADELTQLAHSSRDQVSYLVHELKTPLNSIIGYSELMLRQQQIALENQSPLNSLDNIERVLRNGRRLLHLVNQVLDLSRYESQTVDLEWQTVQIRDLIQQVVDTVEPLATEKSLAVKVDYGNNLPATVVTDPQRLEQILTNLCSNAVRYTDAGGEVQITATSASSDSWQIAIADTGIGISAEEQERIFEPFFRSASVRNSEKLKSSGLGLTITARITALLGGDIQVQSTPGDGSTFTVRFPTAPPLS